MNEQELIEAAEGDFGTEYVMLAGGAIYPASGIDHDDFASVMMRATATVDGTMVSHWGNLK